MNYNGILIYFNNFLPIRKYLNSFLRCAHLRSLLIFMSILSVLSLFICLWYVGYYGKVADFHVTHNGHFVRFADRSSYHADCPHPNKRILENERRIFQSIRQEHVELVKEFAAKKKDLESVLLQLTKRENKLRELDLHITQLRILQRELNDKRNVKLSLPSAPLRPQLFGPKFHSNFTASYDNFDKCIDYRRCSISSLFRFYLYRPPDDYMFASSKSLYDELILSPFRTEDASGACIFVILLEQDDPAVINGLKHWGDAGQNHMIIFNQPSSSFNRNSKYAASIIVSASYESNSYRSGVDIAVKLDLPTPSVIEYQHLPQLLPYAREHLLCFIDRRNTASASEQAILKRLKLSAKSSGDSFLFDLDCEPRNISQPSMDLCYDEKRRVSITRRAHFALIFADRPSTQIRFWETLMAGAIPVLVASPARVTALPFDDFVDWRLATVKIAAARLPELHFILRSISSADLLEMRRKGRFFLENYLANTRVLSRVILSTLRYRLQMLADGTPSVEMNITDSSLTFLSTVTRPPYDDEYLGPMEAPIPSSAFTHNFTSLRMYSHKIWNDSPSHVHFTPEYLENDVAYPSDVEFDDEANFGMRPISPGSGQEFSLALGGNRQREQFTIIMATYNRDAVLNASLERLYQLPYLNKVLVVWNNVDRPNNLNWPRIHVPIVFLNASRNSLNNRFLPFREVETEAVLSLDDDIDLKQHEIIFAFRTWRENRHRIVGFPARYHARYGDSMFYNSNHTCQLSMILTGAAFFHKSYLHTYTYSMPEIIRKKVDEWMNCEDLAMNFLVSHLTRLPPIKTTSKWTLKCPTCPETLSDEASHFNERHNCIRFFTQVYGYNPLLFSQIRADSVLFKTRVPPNHQKCFKYV